MKHFIHGALLLLYLTFVRHQVYQPFIWIMLPQYRSHNMPIYYITKAELSHKHDVKVTASERKKNYNIQHNSRNAEKYYCFARENDTQNGSSKKTPPKRLKSEKCKGGKALPQIAKAIFIYQHHNRYNNKAIVTRKMWG